MARSRFDCSSHGQRYCFVSWTAPAGWSWCPLSASKKNALNGRDGRNAECPVLRALTIRRDAVWPKAASPLRRRSAGKADGPLPTLPSHSIVIVRSPKADVPTAGISAGGQSSQTRGHAPLANRAKCNAGQDDCCGKDEDGIESLAKDDRRQPNTENRRREDTE